MAAFPQAVNDGGQPGASATPRDEAGRFTAQSNTVAYWLKELEAAKKREEKFLKAAEKTLELYESEEDKDNAYNILYSNTEVLLPALYNSTPSPVVGRRYKDEDPLGLAVSRTLGRALEYCIDTPDPNYDPFDNLVTTAVLSALTAGRGLTWLKYDAKFEPIQVPALEKEIEKEGTTATEGDLNPDNAVPAGDAAAGGAGVPGPAPMTPPAQAGGAGGQPDERVTYEAVCGQDVPYDKVRFGFARKWSGMPWVARHHQMSYTDLVEAFGKVTADKITLNMPEGGNRALDDVSDTADREKIKTFGTCDVWEIWHKSSKKVHFICEQLKDQPLKSVLDPLGLKGFYPCPKPLMLFARPSSLVPVPLYMKYRNQAQELNRLTLRINRIIEALKVRGFYDAGLRGLDELLTSDDNTMLPARMVSSMREGATPENSIWLMPLDKLQGVLQGLYQQREQIKQTIYEITGISDIIRGSTAASESATAQKLKSQYGTMRLRRMQNIVQFYVRDVLRLMSEIIANKFSPETLKSMTNLDFPTGQEKQAGQQRLQQLQQIQQQVQQSGADPQQLQQDPQVQQMMQEGQKLQAVVAKPSWDEIKQMLGDSLLFKYRIDIETDSTIDPESADDKQAISDVMMAIAQIFQNVGPLVQEGVFPMGALKGLLLTIVRRFRFGDELEEYLSQIPDQAPPQQQDPAADAKKAESEAKVKLLQMDMQAKEKENQQKMTLMDKELQIKEQELALKQQELELKQIELNQKRELNEITHTGKMQAANATAQSKMMQIDLANQAAQQKAMQPQAPVGVQ